MTTIQTETVFFIREIASLYKDFIKNSKQIDTFIKKDKLWEALRHLRIVGYEMEPIHLHYINYHEKNGYCNLRNEYKAEFKNMSPLKWKFFDAIIKELNKVWKDRLAVLSLNNPQAFLNYKEILGADYANYKCYDKYKDYIVRYVN